MKGGMAIIAKQKTDSRFSIDKDGSTFLVNELRPLLRNITNEYASAIPYMSAIPTTAGTGSEGGKSAVITDNTGVKFVFGHPEFFPKLVALAPQLTEKMPPSLTAATGIDALFHLLEAYFVTERAAVADGLDSQGIARCDNYALTGTRLVAKWLMRAFFHGTDLEARLYMQVAALYGAKAFRKGDLGGVHASAHAIGSVYHVHHGTAIARMSVPVLKWNEMRADEELKKKLEVVRGIFEENGFKGKFSEMLKVFLKAMGMELGLSGLKVSDKDISTLAELASKDGCQTNPIPLGVQDYKEIFKDASRMT